jgi:hypothetical protein
MDLIKRWPKLTEPERERELNTLNNISRARNPNGLKIKEKMKLKQRCEFEPADFSGCGQIILRTSDPTENLDFSITLAYKVGYLHTKEVGKQDEIMGNVYCLISLADGQISPYGTLGQLCVHLNNDEKGYRPASLAEVEAIVGGHGSRFKFSANKASVCLNQVDHL